MPTPFLASYLLMMQILQIGADVATGLAYLHPSVVHRDLKVTLLPFCGAAAAAAAVRPYHATPTARAAKPCSAHHTHTHTCARARAAHTLQRPQPQNVLLDRSGRAKIGDFGISRCVGTAAPAPLVAGAHLIPQTFCFMAKPLC